MADKGKRKGTAHGAVVAVALRDAARARSLATALTRNNGFDVVILSSPDSDSVRQLARRPSILVLEISGVASDGRRLRKIARDNPDIRIVAIGPHDDDPLHFIESGAMLVLDANGDRDIVARAVRALSKGTAPLDPDVMALVVRRLHELARICADDGVDPQRCATLSSREQKVCEFLALGASNRDIADELGLSVGTVKSHVHHVLQKLEVEDRRTAGAYWRLYRQSGPGKKAPA